MSEHEHEYDDVTGEPFVCPVDGCDFNVCEICRVNPGIYQVDPYDADVNDVQTWRVLCENCAQELADDI